MPLYKYVHPDRVDILRDQTIRFSPRSVLNDPFELAPHFSGLSTPQEIAQLADQLVPETVEEIIEKLGNAPGIRETVIAYVNSRMPYVKLQTEIISALATPIFKKHFESGFLDSIGVLCLAEHPDNLLMWAHYGDAHRGFVIEFDERSPFFNQQLSPDDELRHLRKVLYSDERPSLTLSQVESFAPFLTKGNAWSYEAEWRIMLPLASASRTLEVGSEQIHLFHFPETSIVRIIFGCRMPEAQKAKIRELIAQIPKLDHIQFAEAAIDHKHYRVNIA